MGKNRVSITWLGVAGLHISDGETNLLIDPYISRVSLLDCLLYRDVSSDRSRVASWLTKYKIASINAVIVSESHFDHALDAPSVAGITGAPLFGSESTANIARGAGLPEKQINIVPYGDIERFGRFSITFMQSRHTPAIGNHVIDDGFISEPLYQPAHPHRFKMGGHFFFLVQHPSGNVITHTTPFDDLRVRFPEELEISALFSSVLGRRNTERFLHRVVDPIRPEVLYPIHVDNFFTELPRDIAAFKPSPLAAVHSLVRVVNNRSSSYRVEIPKPYSPVIV